MPSLTVKAAAELLRIPAFSQVRILTQQKYPKAGSQVFRTPYYRTALNGIRSYFDEGNSKKALSKAKTAAESLSQESKRDNNKRVLAAFGKSDFAKRIITPEKNSKVVASLGGVEFRLSPDLRGSENGKSKVFYINCRAEVLDPEIARLSLEIAHWVLRQNNEKVSMAQLEFIDLFSGNTYNYAKARSRTMAALEQNAKIIDAVWPTL